ncbi:MAG: glycosyltransferase family 4 protein [Polyangiaceae bacterium]
MVPTVQFVSKPVDPPINDGTKHIVLTLARQMTRYAPRVMTTRGVEDVGAGIGVDSIYEPASSYAPSLLNNLRAVKHLALNRHARIWNFVFAPNALSSQMGRLLSGVRRVRVVQTIASRPSAFVEPRKLLFGDIVVAQSEDTRRRFESAFDAEKVAKEARPRIEVIAPPLGDVRIPDIDATNAIRRELEIGPDVPILLYPGDLEVSQGASRVARAAGRILAQHGTAVVVFAFREKTPHATTRATALRQELADIVPLERVRFVRECRDILALVRTSAAVLFPVDELYGKVDLPIVLLEAMALGTPVVVTDEGPLSELDGALRVAPNEDVALANTAILLIDDHGRRARCVEDQYRALRERFSVERVVRAYEGLYDELLK